MAAGCALGYWEACVGGARDDGRATRRSRRPAPSAHPPSTGRREEAKATRVFDRRGGGQRSGGRATPPQVASSTHAGAFSLHGVLEKHGVCSLRNPTGQTMPRTSTEPIPCVGSMCEPVAADDVNGGHRAAVPGAVSATHPTSPIKASPFEGRACLPTFTLEGRRTSAPGEASSHLLPHEPLADAQVRLVGDGDAARSETAIGWCLRRIAKRVRGVSHRPTVYGVVVVDSVPTRATATATAGTASATSGTVGGNVGDGILGANARRPDDLASGNRNNGARGHHHPLLG